MNVRFAGALALFVALALPSETQGAVFAGHLQMVDNGNGTYDLNYRLNEDANQGVTIRVKGPAPLATAVRTITLGAQVKGEHTVQWDGKNDASSDVLSGQYSWEIEASTNNSGTDPYVLTVPGTEIHHTFYIPYGVDTCNITTSTHFGTIYVSNSGGTVAANNRETTDGIYILSNDMADITGQGAAAYGGSVAWGEGASPFRCHVAPDGKIFITDWSDSNSGIWIMNPDDPNQPFAELFADKTRNGDGLTSQHGSISSVYVIGAGEDRVIYTLDEDFTDPPGTGGQEGSAWEYAIGAADSGYAGGFSIEYDDLTHANRIINFNGKVVLDKMQGRGDWFISQYRSVEVTANPNVFHFDGTNVDWESSVDNVGLLNTLNAGPIDVNADGTLLAAGGNGYLKVLDVSNLNAVVPVFEDTPAGNTKRDVAFDAAGNILLSSSSAETLIYYSKQGENTFVTPNPVGSEITVINTSVEGWEIY